MNIIINPGSGPVANATIENAESNMAAFSAEVGGEWTGPFGAERAGRWTYRVKRGNREIEVEMPGAPPEHVRYVAAPEQNIWDFPRLYVDGSSWIWCYGVGVVDRILAGDGDGEE